MSAPFVVRRACELTSIALLLDVGCAYFLDPASGGARLSTGLALLNAAFMAGLLWKIAEGSTAARFTFSATVVVSTTWSLVSLELTWPAAIFNLAVVALQVGAVALLYREKAGIWFARKRLAERQEH